MDVVLLLKFGFAAPRRKRPHRAANHTVIERTICTELWD